MSILIRHILRNIREHRALTALMVISLALSSAVVYLSLNISDDLLAVSESMIDANYGGYDLIAYSRNNGTVYDASDFAGIDILPVIVKADTGEIQTKSDFSLGDSSAYLIKAVGNIDDYCDMLKGRFPALDFAYVDERIDVDQQLGALRSILSLMILFTVAIGYFVIQSTTAQLLEYRRQSIAVFRSIGAGRRQTGLILLLENLTYGLSGGFLGLLIGAFLRYLLVVLYYDAADAHRSLRPAFIAATLLFALALQLAITFSSLRKSARISIREAVFTKPQSAFTLSLPETVLAAALLVAALVLRLFNQRYDFTLNLLALFALTLGVYGFVPFIVRLFSEKLASAVLKANRGDWFLPVKHLFAAKSDIAQIRLCCMVTALTLSVSICVGSVNAYYVNYEKNYPFDIFIKGMDMDAEQYSFTAEIPGIEQLIVEFWSYGSWNLDGEETKLCFVRKNGYSGIITSDDGLEDSLQSGHALVDRVLSKKEGLRVGDCVQFSNTDGTQPFSVVIDGFCDSGFFNSKRNSVLLSEEDYYRYISRSPALIGAVLDGSYDYDHYISLLQDVIYAKTGDVVRIVSSREYIDKELDNVKAALAALSVLPVCALGVSIIGIVNHQVMSFRTKKREFAVFYSFGVSRAALKKLLRREMCGIYLVGSFCGLVLSLWQVRICRDIIFGLVAYIPLRLNPFITLGVLALGFAALQSAALLLIRKIDAFHVTEEIRYE